MVRALLCLSLCLVSCQKATVGVPLSSVTPADAIATAERYRTHRWKATEANALHGLDPDGIRIDTPDVGFQVEGTRPGFWKTEGWNVGIPYQWGGFSTPEEFDAGLLAGKFAGDVYTAEKRKKLDDAVSQHAVGVDCSGFISRCWQLPRSYSTRELPGLCDELKDWGELRPGDILNTHNSHVLLFAGWAEGKEGEVLIGYETGSPEGWKVLRHPIEVAYLRKLGYRAWRYRGMAN